MFILECGKYLQSESGLNIFFFQGWIHDVVMRRVFWLMLASLPERGACAAWALLNYCVSTACRSCLLQLHALLLLCAGNCYTLTACNPPFIWLEKERHERLPAALRVVTCSCRNELKVSRSSQSVVIITEELYFWCLWLVVCTLKLQLKVVLPTNVIAVYRVENCFSHRRKTGIMLNL